VAPDVYDAETGRLQWNDLGSLVPGESTSMWVEFVPGWACGKTSNSATVLGDGLVVQDTAALRVLYTIARVGGFAYHDDNGDGALNLPCVDGDVSPAGCEPGVEGAIAQTTLPDGRVFDNTTNTSGWYSFNLLDPATYHVEVAAPEGSWWTPAGEQSCDAVVVNKWDEIHCHVGYQWGHDWPQAQATRRRAEDDAPAEAVQEITLAPVQDASISEWNPANDGAAEHLQVRQPGVDSALVSFDLSAIPEGAQIVSARLRLYSPFGSNETNRLYMTVYPLDKGWVEGEVSWTEAAAGVPWAAAGAGADHGEPVGWGWLAGPGWVSIDLDPASLLGSGNGLLIRGEGSESRQVAYWFFSREYENEAVRPQLVVEYEGV
jgi:hypothetical protein